jgi:hypothetical protein
VGSDELEELVRLDPSGRRHDEVIGDQMALEMASDPGKLQPGDRRRRAGDRKRERMIAEERPVDEVAGQVLGTVLDRGDFGEDDGPLTLQLLLHSGRKSMGREITDEGERARKVLEEHACMKAERLLARERVHPPSEEIDLSIDRVGGAGGRALEHEVLDQVGDPVCAGSLLPGAGRKIEAERDALHACKRLAHHDRPRVELGARHPHEPVPSVLFEGLPSGPVTVV